MNTESENIVNSRRPPKSCYLPRTNKRCAQKSWSRGF